MDRENLVVESDPAVADVQFLQERLYEYNVRQTGVDDGQWLAIFVRDDQQQILAGLEGWTWCGSCYIRHVWVHEELRGQGYGTRLMGAAEQEAAARGCSHMVLASYNFQAPEFYQRLGYEVFAVLEGHPRQQRDYYLHKWLRDDASSTQP